MITFTEADVDRYIAERLPHAKRQGREWRAKCPVHKGTRLSFAINAETGCAQCFSECGRGWDLVALEQELTGADFKGAVATLESIVGRPLANGNGASRPAIVATYDYTDESGALLSQVVRYVPKDFRQRRPDGRGGWIWNLEGVRPVPYRLPDVLAASELLIVEGERDADTARRLGFTATCNAQGAGKWRAEYSQYLAGKRVTIIPDADDPGRKHALQVAGTLIGTAAAVAILELPRGKDLTEWVQAGGTREQLAGLVAGAEPLTTETLRARAEQWFPEVMAKPAGGSRSEPNTDLTSGGSDRASQKSQATKLLELAWDGIEYFHCPASRPYARFEINGHAETHGVRTKGFKLFLQQRYFEHKNTALSSKNLTDALGVLEAAALFHGPEHPVYTRVGRHGGNLYLDLGNAAWEAVEITPAGWQVVSNPPVRFRRPRGMMPIASPVRDAESIGHLRDLFNVDPDGNDLDLLAAWLLAALRPEGPYPILVFNSEAGSGKSTAAKVVRRLIDPNEAPVRCQPREERDFMITASNGHIIAFDNLSHLPEWLSDGICRLSTGGGFATRELYSDEDELILNVMKPCTLNGIDEFVTRGDLADRSIVIELPAIPENRRVPEKEFWARFDRYAPGILGFLLDCTSTALRRLPDVKLARLPRMADFAMWVTATEPALGWEDGYFLSIYDANRKAANAVTLEASPIARHLLNLGIWDGTATELLQRLNTVASEQERHSKAWPQSPKGLSNAIRRILPNLRAAGVLVTFDRDSSSSRNRTISITRLVV